MKSTISDVQKKIKVGTHGEDYGSWMSNPVFYVFGGIALVTLVLTALSFTVFRITVLGVVFAAATVILVALLCWMAWIRRQYAFGKGGMMEKVHQTILSSLDFDGHGSLLEVGCGSGALAVRAALTWPEAKITGLDYWGAMYNYSKALCEKNAASEGVGKQCGFVHGDANKLDFPDGSFDAVISNYVYHNIMGADKHGNALALAAGKRAACLADDGIKAVRQCHDKVVAPRLLCGGLHLLHGGVGLAKADIVGDGVGEQIDPLKHKGEIADQTVVAVFPHIPPAETYAA